MTSLRSVLAFNMKDRRHILRITQAQLAERVDTSTNYIALIESEKKFPSPEMLERIAAALGIDAPALFSTTSYPRPETGAIAEFQEQLTRDFAQMLAYRMEKLRELPPEAAPGADKDPRMA
jgi:transcriptional regulator with XRE-family HTH domain